MSKKGIIAKEVIEHQRLIDRVKGIDMANYERLSQDSGVPVELIVRAVSGDEEMIIKRALDSIDARIKMSEKLSLSQEYISGLSDTKKLLKSL